MNKQAGLTPNVEGFLTVLSGALTQYDQRASGKRGYNPYALAQYFMALQTVESDTARFKHSQEPEALEALKVSLGRRFTRDFPPAKAVIKAIDAFLESGKVPKYPVSVSKYGENIALRVAVRFVQAEALQAEEQAKS